MIYTTAADCIAAAAKAFWVTPEQITGPRRIRHIAYARFAAAHLARRLTHQSLPELGLRFGKRDHTTMMNAIRRADQMLAENLDFATRYQAARETLPRDEPLSGKHGEFHRHGSLGLTFHRHTTATAA